MTKRSLAWAAGALVALVSGSTWLMTRQDNRLVRVRRGGAPEEDRPVTELARRHAEYAVLAANAYGAGLAAPGWQRAETQEDVRRGYHAEVWEHAATDRVVVAYRGTGEWVDWWSNLRFATRWIPFLVYDQYPLARQGIAGLVSRAKARQPGRTLTFIAAGHSLGGGLAQHAAYSHAEIRQVFAFDSSPLTGFRDLEAPEVAGLVIDRVYEKGEILAYVRGFLRRQVLPLSVRDPAITEYRYDFVRGGLIAQHDMIDLARRLVAEAAR